MRVYAFPPDNRRRDLDNFQKPLQDALQYAGVYPDDCAIDDYHVTREAVRRPNGVLEVIIEKIDVETGPAAVVCGCGAFAHRGLPGVGTDGEE